jgi:hypothetical protein
VEEDLGKIVSLLSYLLCHSPGGEIDPEALILSLNDIRFVFSLGIMRVAVVEMHRCSIFDLIF